MLAWDPLQVTKWIKSRALAIVVTFLFFTVSISSWFSTFSLKRSSSKLFSVSSDTELTNSVLFSFSLLSVENTEMLKFETTEEISLCHLNNQDTLLFVFPLYSLSILRNVLFTLSKVSCILSKSMDAYSQNSKLAKSKQVCTYPNCSPLSALVGAQGASPVLLLLF